MDVIILAGGFATRMGSLTKDIPKQLLPLGNKTIIDYVLKSIEPLNPIHTFISTNSKFVKYFEDFIKNYTGPLSLELIEEEALAESEKRGLYDVQDLSLAKLYGIVTLDGFKITNLTEKPTSPSSTLASTALWLLSESGQESLINYLGLDFEKDSMGAFMAYHCIHSHVDGLVYTDSWFDIGSPEAYQAAIEWTNSEGDLS